MRKTKSSILAAVHGTAQGLYKAGVLDQDSLREFEQLARGGTNQSGRTRGPGWKARLAEKRSKLTPKS